jgi:proline iminopeptidase
MKSNLTTKLWTQTVFVLITIVCFSLSSKDSHGIPPDFGFTPPVEPYLKEYLRVSKIHEIYYELSGNPKGTPAFMLHGGPGIGFSPSFRQIFDPVKFMVVLADQRGCGRSRPLYETRENTTKDLIEDIEKLRRQLKLEKIMLVGGSWGATLALAYAETYPESVSAIVLRAVFLGTKEEIDFVYKPAGLEKFFPEVFERVANEINPGSSEIDRERLEEFLLSEDPKISGRFAKLWSWYEIKITSLDIPDSVVDRIVNGQYPNQGLARLETNYALNNFFLEEGQIMKNADRIKNIPVTIVQGRYDMMTPPITAYRLHKKLPKSKLWIAESAGHTDWDLPVAKKLLEAVEQYSKK